MDCVWLGDIAYEHNPFVSDNSIVPRDLRRSGQALSRQSGHFPFPKQNARHTTPEKRTQTRSLLQVPGGPIPTSDSAPFVLRTILFYMTAWALCRQERHIVESGSVFALKSQYILIKYNDYFFLQYRPCLRKLVKRSHLDSCGTAVWPASKLHPILCCMDYK